MTKFDAIIKEFGYKRLYKNVNLFMSKKVDKNGYYTIAFPTYDYSDFDLNDDRVTKEFVSGYIRAYCCHTKFKKDIKSNTYILMADYYAHRYNFKKELFWAKKAMKENRELTPKCFSSVIREKL